MLTCHIWCICQGQSHHIPSSTRQCSLVRGSWEKMCRESYFCAFILRHPLDSLLSDSHSSSRTEECSHKAAPGRRGCPANIFTQSLSTATAGGGICAIICLVFAQAKAFLLGKDLTFSIHMFTSIWFNFQGLRGSEKQMISKRKSRTEKGKQKSSSQII